MQGSHGLVRGRRGAYCVAPLGAVAVVSPASISVGVDGVEAGAQVVREWNGAEGSTTGGRGDACRPRLGEVSPLSALHLDKKIIHVMTHCQPGQMVSGGCVAVEVLGDCVGGALAQPL